MSDVKISKKKPSFPVRKPLVAFLEQYERTAKIPISYDDLLHFKDGVVVYNKKGEDSLWLRVLYEEHERIEIDRYLKKTYALLLSDGSDSTLPFLNIDAVDFCTFGNSKPFRIKVRNILNDNFVYFYIKKADASRIYGLELEHMLSPYNLNYLVHENTLVEEHIAGIPGDEFIEDYLAHCSASEKAQIAKEFVKFNERCMIRLLGDMRSYNYVIVPTHDFDQVVYRIRAIDFDQQSYEGKLNVYRPQFFKENLEMMGLVKGILNKKSIDQYKTEERSMVAKRAMSSGRRIKTLLACQLKDRISTPENIQSLSQQIFALTGDDYFLKMSSMGEILAGAIHYIRRNYENHQMLGAS